MSPLTYESMRKRIAENLNVRVKDFHRTVADISENFRNLGLEAAVWYPEKICTVNIGGIDADSYFGYSRIEGRWGLVIRILERDHATRAFVNQRVMTLEACGNAEIVLQALRKAPDLMQCIQETVQRLMDALAQPDASLNQLRNPECQF